MFLYLGNNLNVLASDSTILSSARILACLPLVRVYLQYTLNTPMLFANFLGKAAPSATCL